MKKFFPLQFLIRICFLQLFKKLQVPKTEIKTFQMFIFFTPAFVSF
jgi:hypothetical protein